MTLLFALKLVGLVLLSISYILTFIHADFLDLMKIEESLAEKDGKVDRLKAEKCLRNRRAWVGLLYLAGVGSALLALSHA